MMDWHKLSEFRIPLMGVAILYIMLFHSGSSCTMRQCLAHFEMVTLESKCLRCFLPLVYFAR